MSQNAVQLYVVVGCPFCRNFECCNKLLCKVKIDQHVEIRINSVNKVNKFWRFFFLSFFLLFLLLEPNFDIDFSLIVLSRN